MPTHDADTTRRRFLAYFSSVGLSATLLPGVLWGQMQEEHAPKVKPEMVTSAAVLSGLEFSDEERQQMLSGVNQNLERYQELRKIHIDDAIGPPFYYSPLVPGTKLDRTKKPFRASDPPA